MEREVKKYGLLAEAAAVQCLGTSVWESRMVEEIYSGLCRPYKTFSQLKLRIKLDMINDPIVENINR